MNQHRPLLLLASIALATSVLGACSPGSSSPTEPALSFDTAKSFAADSFAGDDATAGDAAAKRHGSDDGNDNGGSGGGNDDGTADQGRNGGGNGNGDNNSGRRNRGRNGRGRGGDDPQQPRAPRNGQEFEATVQSVAGSTITLVTGTRVIVNGQTQWSARGDLLTLQALAAAAARNNPAPRVEGRGNRQADGSILALTIKAEIDE